MIRFLQSGNKAAKYILGGFLTILAVSMVAYLIPGFMSGANSSGQSGTVASVNGVNIQHDDVLRLAQQQVEQARASGRQVPSFLLPMLRQRAAEELIQREEVAYEAGRLGLMVSDQEIFDELMREMNQDPGLKEMFFPGGKWVGDKEFDKKFEQLLADRGRTVADFRRDMRNDLLRRKLYYTIAAGVTVPQTDVEKMYKDQNLKVKFQYAVLNLEDIQKQIKPTDAELKAFFEKEKDRYTNFIPEKRQIRYFLLEDKAAEGKVIVDPAEVQRYYSNHPDDFRTPERVRARHILIAPAAKPGEKPDQKAIEEARAKAVDVLKQVRAGGDFAELAKKYSQDPGSAPNGGELGWSTREAWVAPFANVAFAQAPGQISDLVQTDFGFHIIQTEEKQAAGVRQFSEVKDEIEKQLKAVNRNKYLNQEQMAAQGQAQKEGLDKAAAKRGLAVIESNPIARTDQLPGIGANPQLMSAIFSISEKSAPTAARYAGGYVVFEVTKSVPARTPPFEEIKDRVASDFKSKQASELLQKKTQTMADRAHSEHDLAKAAKEAGATLKTGDLVSRTSQVAELGSMGGPLSAAFDLKPGEISGALNLGAKGVVLQVTDRQEASLSNATFAAESQNLREQLTERKRQQMVELFMTDLRTRLEKEGKLKIYKNEMDNLKARS
jgi:peptidyl-prolyl cis-trans isomerase D